MSEATAPPPKPRSDLGIRTISGVLMMSIAIAAIWYGGDAFTALVILVGGGVLWEFAKLVFAFTSGVVARILWISGGILYVSLACLYLLMASIGIGGMTPAIMTIAGVIGTDVGAYFAGRTFGGPKIAPRISPSKTWSGLVGGMIGAGAIMIAVQSGFFWIIVQSGYDPEWHPKYSWTYLVISGVGLAAVAQAGDFFESWMKRRAGVKDSGRLIPGHGGLFDRVDGLLAVSFVAALITIGQVIWIENF